MNGVVPAIDARRLARAWHELERSAADARPIPLARMFAQEPDRLNALVIDAAGLRVDFGRQRIPLDVLSILGELAGAAAIPEWRDAMLRGELVNSSERRAALHTALRDPDALVSPVLDPALHATVRDTLARMRAISTDVRSAQWRGASGRPISDVLHIGIGGSQLGPEFACDALRRIAHPRLRVHFLGNIDPHSWARLALDLNPLTTLVIIASKSWRTPETLRNGEAVRQWLLDAGVSEVDLGCHLIAVSSDLQAAQALGVLPENILPCPDWVGGRYSMWGAVGLPLMIQIGADAFEAMLAGASRMDQHFKQADLTRNVPVMLALTSAWNAALLGSGTEAVIPYSDALRRFPAHLQQLQMESNGKSASGTGEPLTRASMPVVWGEPGTDSQHSFFQALHQGVAVHPVDLIVVGGASDSDRWQRGRALNANAVAQAQALSLGRDDPDPQRRHPGGRPVTMIHLPQLDPAALGALVALYEHKTVTLGWLWGLNPFDQWGVELGKWLAVVVEKQLGESDAGAASSTGPEAKLADSAVAGVPGAVGPQGAPEVDPATQATQATVAYLRSL